MTHVSKKRESDTWKHDRAGADVVIGVTQTELVKFSHENNLTKALDELADTGVDFAVVEGFKESKLPKMALGNVEAINILKRFDKPESADIEDIINITVVYKKHCYFLI
ncbi:MAG: molybdopterin-guanine dinucleotide biosynthesis protein MobB [Candidatus Methanoperedens sp.]